MIFADQNALVFRREGKGLLVLGVAAVMGLIALVMALLRFIGRK